MKIYGRQVKADTAQIILEVCRREGIFIPYFVDCHHHPSQIRQTCLIPTVKV